MKEEFNSLREWMVISQIKQRGITDKRILDAMITVPRHKFVWEADGASAYGDHPLRIGKGQTISQPYMVAFMTDCLKLSGGEKVLEIGTGSGYQAAVLAEIGCSVFSIERIPELYEYAKQRLSRTGYGNVTLKLGDGTLGWAEEAPFDRIIVTAGAPAIPASLTEQLAEDGIMCVPAGGKTLQHLLVSHKINGKVKTTEDIACIFVPLIGKEGWPE